MIRLSLTAEKDLRRIDAWIRKDNGPLTAARVTEAILTSIEHLERFPELGRPGRLAGTRELGIAHLPYIAVYRLAAGDVVIARVLHGAQLWPRPGTGGSSR